MKMKILIKTAVNIKNKFIYNDLDNPKEQGVGEVGKDNEVDTGINLKKDDIISYLKINKRGEVEINDKDVTDKVLTEEERKEDSKWEIDDCKIIFGDREQKLIFRLIKGYGKGLAVPKVYYYFSVPFDYEGYEPNFKWEKMIKVNIKDNNSYAVFDSNGNILKANYDGKVILNGKFELPISSDNFLRPEYIAEKVSVHGVEGMISVVGKKINGQDLIYIFSKEGNVLYKKILGKGFYHWFPKYDILINSDERGDVAKSVNGIEIDDSKITNYLAVDKSHIVGIAPDEQDKYRNQQIKVVNIKNGKAKTWYKITPEAGAPLEDISSLTTNAGKILVTTSNRKVIFGDESMANPAVDLSKNIRSIRESAISPDGEHYILLAYDFEGRGYSLVVDGVVERIIPSRGDYSIKFLEDGKFVILNKINDTEYIVYSGQVPSADQQKLSKEVENYKKQVNDVLKLINSTEMTPQELEIFIKKMREEEEKLKKWEAAIKRRIEVSEGENKEYRDTIKKLKDENYELNEDLKKAERRNNKLTSLLKEIYKNSNPKKRFIRGGITGYEISNALYEKLKNLFDQDKDGKDRDKDGKSN